MSVFHSVPRVPREKMERLPASAAEKRTRHQPKNYLADFLAFGLYRHPNFRTFLLFLSSKSANQ